MRRQCKQCGMSLMELIVALAIILILISSLIGVGSYVKTRADIDLTKGMLETLCTALEQYYDDLGDFPFDTPDSLPPDDNGFLGDDYDAAGLIGDVDPANPDPTDITVISSGTLPEHTSAKTAYPIPAASSAALFYFLDKNPSSRATLDAVPNSLVTNKDNSGADIKLTLTVSGNPIDLPRYIDPWGVSIRYVYLDGTAFPALTSAGPDKIFDTPDDITSK